MASVHPAEEALLRAIFGEKKPVRDEVALAEFEVRLLDLKRSGDMAGIRALLPKLNALRRGL